MAKPRVFVSSTHYDLKHIRSSLDQFLESLGFEAVVSEKGGIAYDPKLPLDESCYREASGCDILLLLIGGRYGSAASDDLVGDNLPRDFYDRYESITKKEYEAAAEKGIPTYILIEKAVYGEYQTFTRNRDQKDINYAHVDSVNIFYMIDQILRRPRNNPVHQFEGYADIELWLRDQWSGLFRELLAQRSRGEEIATLSSKIVELGELNKTLKRYLEEVVSKVSADEGPAIIESESERLTEAKKLAAFAGTAAAQDMIRAFDLDFEAGADLLQSAESFEDLSRRVQSIPKLRGDDSTRTAEDLLAFWKENEWARRDVNQGREALGLPDLDFEGDAD